MAGTRLAKLIPALAMLALTPAAALAEEPAGYVRGSRPATPGSTFSRTNWP